MQNKINLDTHNVVIPVNEPWHRGSGFTWMLLALAGAVFFLSGAVSKAQTTYTTGADNWNTGSRQGNANEFSVNNGVAIWSADSNVDWGIVNWRNFTTDGSLSGAQQDLRVGQSVTIRMAGANSGSPSRTGVANNGAIGFALAAGSGAPSTSPGNTAAQALDNTRFRVEFVGGASSVTAVGSSTDSSGLPGFADFKSGQTYTIERVSLDEVNFKVAGGATYNLKNLGGSSGSGIGSIRIYNRGSNMNAEFTDLSVANMASVTLTKNSGETATITGEITKNGASNNNVVKNGDGTVILTAANTYAGTTTVENGILQVGNNGALSTGNVTVNSGGTLQMAANVSNQTTLNGTGEGGVGAIRNTSGNNTHSGAISLGSNSSIKSEAGSLALSGGITGTGNTLTVNGNANTTISTSGLNTGTGGALVKNDTGTLFLSANGNYTGSTTINAGKVEVQANQGLGTADGKTTVADGAQLRFFTSGSGLSVAENIDAGGTGSGGAILSTGGNNSLTGTVTLNANTRIGVNTSGGAGSLTVGAVNGGANVLYTGTDGANITVNGVISGSGNTQDGTTTSLYKDGSSTLTLTGANTYSGDTRLEAGTLTVSGDGTLGDGSSDVYLKGDTTLNINKSLTIDSVQDSNPDGAGGVIALANNAILTVDGANKGVLYQNSISGQGGLTMAGSGNTELSLYNAQTYTGTTTISGGKLVSSGALSSAAYSVSGGTFETVGDGKIDNGATIQISGGNFIVGGNDTVGAVEATGGRLSVAGGKTASLSANSTIGSGAEMVGGTIAINNGVTLTLNSNDADNSSALTIASGGTLTGSGTTAGALSVDGFLAPGNSPGTMNVGATTFLGGGTYQWEINDWTGTKGANPGYDWLNVTGALAFASTGLDAITNTNRFTIDVVSLLSSGTLTNFDPASTLSFVIATASGGISNFGTVSSFIDINSAGFLNNDYAGNWSLAVVNGSGSEQSLQLTFASVSGGGGIGMSGATAIPEPSSAALTLIGLGVLALRRRCRR